MSYDALNYLLVCKLTRTLVLTPQDSDSIMTHIVDFVLCIDSYHFESLTLILLPFEKIQATSKYLVLW